MNLKPDVEVLFEFIEERKSNLYEGYRPAHLISENCLITGVHNYYNLEDSLETLKGTITFVSPESYPSYWWKGKKILIYEGKLLVGSATIIKIFNPILCQRESESRLN